MNTWNDFQNMSCEKANVQKSIYSMLPFVTQGRGQQKNIYRCQLTCVKKKIKKGNENTEANYLQVTDGTSGKKEGEWEMKGIVGRAMTLL